MNSREILSQALALKPEERFIIVEGNLKSLDEGVIDRQEMWSSEGLEEERMINVFLGQLELNSFLWNC